MLRLEDMSVTLGDFSLTLDAEVARGDRVALMGASGSGKSTALSLMAGFLWPDRGRLTCEGQDITRAPVATRPMSILFQDGNLFPHLSVRDNVALGLSPSLRLSADDQARVEESLSQVDLDGFGMRRPAQLSGGQRARVALARMLLRDRPIALLDEPFASLDPGLRAEMLDRLNALTDTRGLTLVMVCHDLRDARRLCDRLWMLEEGKLAVDAAMADALADPPELLRPWM